MASGSQAHDPQARSGGTRSDEMERLCWTLIGDIRVCMMTTREGDHLRARPMHGFAGEAAGELWFLTRLDSGKAHEVLADAAVCLAYADPGKQAYVSVSGRARIDTDPERIRRHWTPEAQAWMPDGPEGPDTALVRVTVDAAEWWDTKVGRMRYLLEVTRAGITGTTPDVGEHGHVVVGKGG